MISTSPERSKGGDPVTGTVTKTRRDASTQHTMNESVAAIRGRRRGTDQTERDG